MAYANNMGKLLDKIERRLGMTELIPHLPDSLNKEAWVTTIKEDSIETFSRYYPWKVPYRIDSRTKRKGKWYLLDEELLGNAKIIGAADIDWSNYGNSNSGLTNYGFGYTNPVMMDMSLCDIFGLQMDANIGSLFNNNVYVEFQAPNMVAFVGIGSNDIAFTNLVINVLLEHPISLMTIDPTKMETFEALAIADVARFLYQRLKYFDGIETVYASIDLKLSELNDIAQKGDEVREKLEQNYVSAGNQSIPFMITV